MSNMQSIKDILLKFDPIEDKYISREYQSFGVHLANKLGDETHKGLYIKLAKTIPRAVLEAALRFVVDSKAKSKGALFMWKLKEIGGFQKAMKLPKKVKAIPVKKEKIIKAAEPKKTPYRSSRARKADRPDPLF